MLQSFESEFRAALAHVNAGKLEAAAASCTSLLRDHPNDPAVLQLHAMIALRTGNPGDAMEGIRQSLARRPGHVPSLILAARAARALNRPDRAVAPLRQAVARAPDQPEPAFLLCQTLLDMNDQSLDAVLAHAARMHPTRALEWQRLGVALQRAQRLTAALDAFTRAVTADPTLAAAEFGRGLMLREAGRMTEARSSLERAVNLDPTASAAWFALGLTYQDLQDEAAAAAAYQKALQERPDFAEAAVNLGIALQRRGDMGAAMEAYRTAIRLRRDTMSRIAQAVTAARTGMLWLDQSAFRRALGV